LTKKLLVLASVILAAVFLAGYIVGLNLGRQGTEPSYLEDVSQDIREQLSRFTFVDRATNNTLKKFRGLGWVVQEG